MVNKMIEADNLVKIYRTKETEVMALQGLDLVVEEGELMAIIGNSGSGKSTFLNMLGGLDKPTAGHLIVDGHDVGEMTEKELVEYKKSTVGFVWQNNARNLLPYLTALENICVPMIFSKEPNPKERALELLEMVGMSHRKDNKLAQLSGGEQQRIAIAIALANRPRLLLADEPTGAVDSKTSDHILDLFQRLNKELGLTIVIVTHDVALTKKVGRVVAIRDGKIARERIMKAGGEEEYEAKDWMTAETHDEFMVIDRAGRIQLPQEYLDKMGITERRIFMHYEDGKIILTKDVNP